jgi:hypothetical protein
MLSCVVCMASYVRRMSWLNDLLVTDGYNRLSSATVKQVQSPICAIIPPSRTCGILCVEPQCSAGALDPLSGHLSSSLQVEAAKRYCLTTPPI